MADEGNSKVVYAALAGNGAIALSKFAASAITGSSAMLSEAIHSTADTGNELLLLLGIRRSRRAPDAAHPFGYGPELYFWSFVVAVVTFALGAGFSLYEGVEKVLAPAPVENPLVNYAVLGVAILFELGSWTVAMRAFRKTQRGASILTTARRSKDPTVFMVLFEDSAALIGLAIAFAATGAAQATGLAVLDGVGSLAIGLLLAVVATLLAIETKSLLIGEAMDPNELADIRCLMERDPAVAAQHGIWSMHLGPGEVLLAASVDFQNRLSGPEVEAAAARLERRIKERHPHARRLFLEVKEGGIGEQAADGARRTRGAAEAPREARS